MISPCSRDPIEAQVYLAFGSYVYHFVHPDSKLHGVNIRAHLGPVGPRWAPCWPHEPCYQGSSTLWIQTEATVQKGPGEKCSYWGKICFDFCDLNLWPLTLTFCMDITSVNGKYPMRGTLWKQCEEQTDGQTDRQTDWIGPFIKLLGAT